MDEGEPDNIWFPGEPRDPRKHLAVGYSRRSASYSDRHNVHSSDCCSPHCTNHNFWIMLQFRFPVIDKRCSKLADCCRQRSGHCKLVRHISLGDRFNHNLPGKCNSDSDGDGYKSPALNPKSRSDLLPRKSQDLAGRKLRRDDGV